MLIISMNYNSVKEKTIFLYKRQKKQKEKAKAKERERHAIHPNGKSLATGNL